VSESIGALAALRDEGKIEAIGVSNLNRAQLDEALDAAPIAAFQLRISLIHREHLPLARHAARRGVTVWAWGALGEGLLTGKFTAATTFGADDRRHRYPEFQGDAWDRNLALAAEVVETARTCGRTPAQVALRWVLDEAGAAVTLFGAKRRAQVMENARCLVSSTSPAVDCTP
jgi:aryl-alcohol dehydrogenase-like predicted oxidoreductase